MNIEWSQKLFEALYNEGVRDLVLCPGARNSPLVAVLSRMSGFTLHSFFEERSGAFFALGLSRRTGAPAAIVTTSGTAAAELLPAVVEAYHTGVPLIAITADRPRRLRGTGAPQAIDQVGLFGKFVSLESDLESGEMPSFEKWNRRTPAHLNICFDEPLLDAPLRDFSFAGGSAHTSFLGTSTFPSSAGAEWASLRLTKFLRSEDPLVVVVGTLESPREREAVTAFLKRFGAPVYLEGTSGLRERADLQSIVLRSGDKLLAWGLKQGFIARVLRIGGVPTVRIWRDLDEATSKIEVLSLTNLPFQGLSRGELVCTEIASCVEAVSLEMKPDSVAGALLVKDRAVEKALSQLYIDEPLAEPSLVHALSKRITPDSVVYVGNSLPIREWDLAASYEQVVAVEANRGVNGIDGQVATFLGLAREGVENWAIMGDLTAMYDLAGPWGLRSRPDVRMNLVIINNGGGKIFSRIFKNDLFENKHSFEFEGWARMWRLPYERWTTIPDSCARAESVVIELVPDNEATQRFWDRYDSFWETRK